MTKSFYSQWGHFLSDEVVDQPDDVAAIWIAQGYAVAVPDPSPEPATPTVPPSLTN